MSLRRVALCLLAALSLPAAAAPSPSALAKIAPWVLQHTDGGAQAEYTVVLADQADLSGAAALETKLEKGRFVYETLYRKAQETQGPILADLQARGVQHRSYYIVNMVWVKGDRDLAYAMAERPDVARIDGNPSVRVILPQAEEVGPDAPEPGLNFIRAPQVWALGFTGQNVVVAGADTGIRWTHNALRPHYRGWDAGTSTANHDYNWHDSIHSSTGVCPGNSAAPCDDNGHGTHTVGTVAGDDGGANNIGVAPGAKWIGCRNMDQGNGTPATYLECFEFFLAPYPVGGTPGQGNAALAPDVTNNSWGCPTSEGCNSGNWETMRLAIAAQRAAGIVTVASAGNAGSSCSSVNDPPAMFDEAYSVGALNTGGDTLASFSSRGPVTVDGSNRIKPDIAAPGTSTRSATRTSDTAYTSMSGTSMAGPHVAGTVALVVGAVPALSGNVNAIEARLSATAVRNATNSTASCSSTAGVYPNNLFGNGRLDALCAVRGNLSGVSIGVAGSTSIGTPQPCLGGSATVTDTDGGTSTHQWGYRTTTGGAITDLPGQTGASYQLNCGHFPSAGTFFLVERTTPQCGAVTVSNEVTVTVNATTPVELQSFQVE